MNGNTSRSPFLDQVRAAIRVRHYSIRTEQAYLGWIWRFILFHNKRHPREMREPEVAGFLTHLAVTRHVSPSTQNQALNALVFMYKHVLDQPLEEIHGIVRAKGKQRLPVVLTPEEIRAILRHLEGIHWLVACLLYGSGLRLMECVRLRVKDLDFSHRAVIVMNGKGGKDRVVTLPDDLIVPLHRHLMAVKLIHDKDLADGYGDAIFPTHWQESIRTLGRAGAGNTCSPRRVEVPTRVPASNAGITSMRAVCRRRSSWPCANQRSTNPQVAIACATVSRPICSSAGWTSARCKSSWGIQTFERLRFIRMSSIGEVLLWSVL